MPAKTVLIIADFGYVEGGAAKVALDSVRLLHKNGYRVILFCGSDRIDSAIEDLGARIVKLGMHQLVDNPSKLRAMVDGIWNRIAANKLRALLSELDPQGTVVHIHSWTKILSPSIFSVLRKSGFKTVMTAHDYFLACPNGAFYDYVHQRLCTFHGGGLRCLFCNCDVRNYPQKIWRWVRQCVVTYQIKRFSQLTLLTISELNNRILKKEVAGKHEFVRVNNPMEISCDNTNLIIDKTDFIFVGRASPEKGLDLFVKAVTECGVHGVVLGDGKVLPKLRSCYPSVEYLGWVHPSRVRNIIRSRAAVFVFPSRWYETAGLSPLEAMAEGVPCIISDVTTASEYIEDGTTGLLFKSGNIDDLKQKIEMMKDVKFRQALSDNIRAMFDIEKWSQATYVRSLNDLYCC